MISKVVIAGAGTMGSGIALANALAGINVVLLDASTDALEKGKASIIKNLDFLVSKNKISIDDHTHVFNRIVFTTDKNICIAPLIVEAIVEKAEPKSALLNELAVLNAPTCILASNTSSLSITELQNRIDGKHRVAGLHFFNPAHIMKLVEVVKGAETADGIITELMDYCRQLGKPGLFVKMLRVL